MTPKTRTVVEGLVNLLMIISVLIGVVLLIIYMFTQDVHTAITALILMVGALLIYGVNE